MIIIISCSLVILPWMIRCYITYDRFVFIKATGFNFYRGNNAEYTETGIPSWLPYEIYQGLTLEGEIDQRAFSLAINYIFTHIPETAMNMINRFVEFWWVPKALPEQSPLLRIAVYAPLLLLFICGLIIDRKRFLEIMPLIIAILGFTLSYSVSFVLPRYRVPIQPIVFIFSAVTFVRILDIVLEKFGLKEKDEEENRENII